VDQLAAGGCVGAGARAVVGAGGVAGVGATDGDAAVSTLQIVTDREMGALDRKNLQCAMVRDSLMTLS
jgi:hypothetical protein